MVLSQKKFQESIEKIEPFLKKGCPLCSNNTFFMDEDLYVHPALDLKTKIIQSKGLYVILATCEKCFLTMSFSTKYAGITD